MGSNVQIQPAYLGKASIQVKADSSRDVLKILLETDKEAGISALTGLDMGEKIGLMYHIRTNSAIITIRTEVSKQEPKIPTITDLIPGAAFHEREAADLFGVIFEGHPNPARLVLPEDWPENLYPLRKDAKIDDATVKSENSKSHAAPAPPESDDSLVNIIIGPQHPALLEPEKFSLKVDGEIVKQVTPRIGYVHRGVEKAAEQRTYLQDVYLVERICGICNSCHAACFVEAVEKILGTQVPPRGKYIRTIILELNRLHSHMLLLEQRFITNL
jgi:Ni,Fe-hydrogenase III component G